jgi:hypothetical protein
MPTTTETPDALVKRELLARRWTRDIFNDPATAPGLIAQIEAGRRSLASTDSNGAELSPREPIDPRPHRFTDSHELRRLCPYETWAEPVAKAYSNALGMGSLVDWSGSTIVPKQVGLKLSLASLLLGNIKELHDLNTSFYEGLVNVSNLLREAGVPLAPRDYILRHLSVQRGCKQAVDEILRLGEEAYLNGELRFECNP